MLIRLISGFFLVFCALNFAHADESISVWSDTKAKYSVFKFEKNPEKKIVIIGTKRDGPSGISFSIREVKCKEYLFRYIADADTVEELALSKPEQKFSALVSGSISEIVSAYACRKAGWK